MLGTAGMLLWSAEPFSNAMNFTLSRFFWVLCWALAGVFAVLMLLAADGAHATPEFDHLLASLTQRWGAKPVPTFNAWRDMVMANMASSDAERLRRVNQFFNQHVQFSDNMTVWGLPDYWATPMESLGRGAGDCKAFVIGKYFTLLRTGMDPQKLRLIYVRAKTGGADNAPTQAHMVLAYYADPEAEPLVLDNLIPDIRPASRRPDLLPIFSFNRDGVFAGVAGNTSPAAGGVGRLSRWEDVLKRARAEGFE